MVPRIPNAFFDIWPFILTLNTFPHFCHFFPFLKQKQKNFIFLNWKDVSRLKKVLATLASDISAMPPIFHSGRLWQICFLNGSACFYRCHGGGRELLASPAQGRPGRLKRRPYADGVQMPRDLWRQERLGLSSPRLSSSVVCITTFLNKNKGKNSIKYKCTDNKLQTVLENMEMKLLVKYRVEQVKNYKGEFEKKHQMRISAFHCNSCEFHNACLCYIINVLEITLINSAVGTWLSWKALVNKSRGFIKVKRNKMLSRKE